VVASKARFHKCLVVMHPDTVKVDLPTPHDITTYIHNQFINLINMLKDKVHVSIYTLSIK
jgi:hypothetical protein